MGACIKVVGLGAVYENFMYIYIYIYMLKKHFRKKRKYIKLKVIGN